MELTQKLSSIYNLIIQTICIYDVNKIFKRILDKLNKIYNKYFIKKLFNKSKKIQSLWQTFFLKQIG